MTREYEEELDSNNYVLRDKPAIHKMVEVALANGWVPDHAWKGDFEEFVIERNSGGRLVVEFFNPNKTPAVRAIKWGDLLFNIEFNKAVWGDMWQQRMKDMVVMPNVFDYIYGHLQNITLDNENK